MKFLFVFAACLAVAMAGLVPRDNNTPDRPMDRDEIMQRTRDLRNERNAQRAEGRGHDAPAGGAAAETRVNHARPARPERPAHIDLSHVIRRDPNAPQPENFHRMVPGARRPDPEGLGTKQRYVITLDEDVHSHIDKMRNMFDHLRALQITILGVENRADGRRIMVHVDEHMAEQIMAITGVVSVEVDSRSEGTRWGERPSHQMVVNIPNSKGDAGYTQEASHQRQEKVKAALISLGLDVVRSVPARSGVLLQCEGDRAMGEMLQQYLRGSERFSDRQRALGAGVMEAFSSLKGLDVFVNNNYGKERPAAGRNAEN